MPPMSKPSSVHPDIPDLPDPAFPPSPVELGRDSTQMTRLFHQSPLLRHSVCVALGSIAHLFCKLKWGERVERISEGMFALSLLEHKLWVPASKLGLPLEDAIRGELESIFLDKVVFHVIMFRPYVGEVISAKLKESNTNGLHCMSLSLGCLASNPSVILRLMQVWWSHFHFLFYICEHYSLAYNFVVKKIHEYR
ncbi:hypothetical protein Cgig2_007196 [Carnegiea gigantea]|uniref:Uncharacterized protein n=1 Tax=Carnegiea gigantea TaxID=171969 RepID=A0A9Q1JFY1_9CARY|nr:hypothetical protein Cgig2_007196 [Carnegiea gigantea]